jgi:hypothetical protein
VDPARRAINVPLAIILSRSTPAPYAGSVSDIRMGWHRPRVQWSRDSGPAAAVQIVQVALIVLKLTGVIAWSWYWVLSPMWISGILLVLGVCAHVIMHDYGLLFKTYPRDLDGTPLGPSRFAPGMPYWQALIATGGQLAAGAVMIALITASERQGVTAAKPVTAP